MRAPGAQPDLARAFLSLRNVSTTLIHPGAAFRVLILWRLPPGFGLSELVGTEVYALRRRTAVGGFLPVRFRARAHGGQTFARWAA